MKKPLHFLFPFLSMFIMHGLHAQCDISFENDAVPLQFNFSDIRVASLDTDIVNYTTDTGEPTPEAYSGSFDIYDEINNDCTTSGGSDDITLDISIPPAYDVYGGAVLNPIGGIRHNVIQDATGLKGNLPAGQSAAHRTSTGDVRSYVIKVTFASHVIVEAADITVNLTSVNSAGQAYESSSIVFFDENGVDYGFANYNGLYVDPDGPGGTHPGVVAACPSTSGPSRKTSADIYTTSAIGAYVMSSNSTVKADLGPNHCVPKADVNGSDDNKNVNAALDALVPPSSLIGGFTLTVRLEDVATATADGVFTGVRTGITSTLNGISMAAVALPVELSRFEASKEGKMAELEWTTVSEENSDYFEVQHSTDGEEFTTIGEVLAAGYSTEELDYAFTHRQPAPGMNYYRLKQVDFDGTYEYSKVRALEFDKDKDENNISIRPTLANNHINLVMEEASEYDLDYMILDITGRMMHSGTLAAGDTMQEIAVSHFPVGQYFLATQGEDGMNTIRFVKY